MTRKAVNIVDMLIEQGSLRGDTNCINFVNENVEVEVAYSFQDLVVKSKAIAYHLIHKLSLKAGDRVLLVYPPSLDFIIAFFGCLMVGVVAVPVYPPDPTKMKKDTRIFNSIKDNSGAVYALSSNLYTTAVKVAGLKNFIVGGESALSELQWVITDPLINGSGHPLWDDSKIFKPSKDDLAFLQYTSGSTSEPKGVMVSHENMFWNMTFMADSFEWLPSQNPNDILFSWLPQYHDMGLLSYLGPICYGCKIYILSPITFIKNPTTWIDGLSKFKATHTSAPNFAYLLAVRKFNDRLKDPKWQERCKTLDFSSLQVLINAAEPVLKSSIDIFENTFEKYGMKRKIIVPYYGLAENVIYVSGPGKGHTHVVIDKVIMETEKRVQITSSENIIKGELSEDGKAIRLMSCGNRTTVPEICRKIVNPDTGVECPDGYIGELWVDSPSKTLGYFRKEELTATTFKAKIVPAPEGTLGVSYENDPYNTLEREYLRTGDLAFYYENELYICGRIKDIIIIRGRNHYPQDIERTSEGVLYKGNEVLRKGCNAVFSIIVSSQEVLVFCAELLESSNNLTIEEYDEIMSAIKKEIVQLHGVPLSVIYLLKTKSIPKTTSGKIARQWVKKAYLEGTLQVKASWSELDNLDNNKLESEKNEAFVANMEKMDPTGIDPELILNELKNMLAYCLDQKPEDIKSDIPLLSLGLDSMQSVQLKGLLKKKFTIPLPDIFSLDPDVTLQNMAEALSKGENFKLTPIMIQSWDAVTSAIKFGKLTKSGNSIVKDQLPDQWFKENQIEADPKTVMFNDDAGLLQVPLTLFDQLLVEGIFLTNYLLFSWLPLVTFLFLVILFRTTLVIYIAVLFYILSVSVAYFVNIEDFKKSNLHTKFQKYFSHRIILESKLETYASTIAVYVFVPHGFFAIPTILQSLIHEFLTGRKLVYLESSSMSSLRPVLQWTRSAYVTASESTLEGLLGTGRCVAIAPGGTGEMFVTSHAHAHVVARERNAFVAAALRSGTAIVPCFCFGSALTVHPVSPGSFASTLARLCSALPVRTPLLTVLGSPIPCPKTDNPSLEIINDYSEKYLRELRRIYECYKNCYGWKGKKLQFQR
jgi:acyl-CoA synthetase (AMP-forming)/AMP-acid ligase II/acyl carrier protein